jgi:hypothetical protein
VTGLIDSHRQGTGKRSRILVRQKTAGGYEVVVQDDPGQVRDNLRLKYGELVQGYRVIPFGSGWASRMNGIGRTRDGIRVLYNTKTAPGIDEAVWGRFAQAAIIDGVSDANDLARRVQQAATKAGKLGKQVGLGLRSGVLQPLDGYDITDLFPVAIDHGGVKTANFGSGYWAAMAVTWEASDQGQQVTTLTLQPREDTVAPNPDLLVLSPISPQAEWQVGWVPPTGPLSLTLSLDTGLLMDAGLTLDQVIVSRTRYHLDLSTGLVYASDDLGVTWVLVSGPPTVLRPTAMSVTSRATVTDAGVTVTNVSVSVTP